MFVLTGKRLGVHASKLVPFVQEQARTFAAELGCTTANIVIGGKSMGGAIPGENERWFRLG